MEARRDMSPAAARQLSARPFWQRAVLGLVALAIASAIWLPSVHLFFQTADAPANSALSAPAFADELAARQLRLWTDPGMRTVEVDRMRASNAEWDFMGRTFLVCALANLSLHEPAQQAEHLVVIDRIIDETLACERQFGVYHFLMPYARAGTFASNPPRSLFVDGEIALMLAARCLVADKPEYRQALRERVAAIDAQMQAGPLLCGESYPDECWLFCNTVALAALRMADEFDGTDHGEFFARWIATAKQQLVHPESGLLVSSFDLQGQPKDGPEGSSIWMAAHCLQVIDPEFARDQYRRARAQLGVELCGFGYAREWPPSWHGPMDIDSGPIVPMLEASAGSSGLAFLGARSFGDARYFRTLVTSIDFAGFPLVSEGERRYAASNQVGDAVLLYSSVCGPLWERLGVKELP